jgi:Uma2 family endonuclease
MADVATRPMTFEEFLALRLDGRYELVNGKVEELVSPRPDHGWTFFKFPIEIGAVCLRLDPDGRWGGEVDVPTVPFHGRRPDFVYFSGTQRANVDDEANRVRGIPTLAVEILSEDDEERDLVTKRTEYARAGIPHYWIVDPVSRTALTLVLKNSQYVEERRFGLGDTFRSSLFPGLAVPLRDLFW